MKLTFVLSCIAAILGACEPEQVEEQSPPSIVFIMADDCTFRDLGCYGGQALTPNIDKLATEGMSFTHCFQCMSMCSPTRHNVYTGQYPIKSGAYANHTWTYRNVKNITHFLGSAGYRVALSGKSHVGPRNLFKFEYSGQDFPVSKRKGNVVTSKGSPNPKAIDELLGECAEDNAPFCLFVCSNDPHTPWTKGDPSLYPVDEIEVPPYLGDTPVIRESLSKYLAEVTYFDDQVGEVLELLEKHELDDDTLVIVASEQGAAFPFAKWTCYDNGLQSALIARWPGRIEPGSVSNAMVEYVDITPTLVELTGAQLSEELSSELDGVSFANVLAGEASEHKSFVFGAMTTKGTLNGNECYPIRSVRSRTHKLIVNLQHDQPLTNPCTQSAEFLSMMAAADAGDQRSKSAVDRYQNRPAIELYDLTADPQELNNLAGGDEHGETISALRRELDAWMASQGDEGVATELIANKHKTDPKNYGRTREEVTGK